MAFVLPRGAETVYKVPSFPELILIILTFGRDLRTYIL